MKAVADEKELCVAFFLLGRKKKHWPERQFSSGADLETLAKEVIDQPPEVIDWLKTLLGK
jgi:hypothetical protein